uniref:MBG domain-containing protein n=1 Tax=Fibrobacter sp. TaxID=35828 RepID=UPI003890697D
DHPVTGFTATTEETLYDVTNVALATGKTASATTKNVGKVPMGLTAESFVNNDKNFTVTFTVTDGYSEVTPKAVVVKATAAQKTYGDADPTLASTVEGLVEGESESLIVRTVARATGENVGTYAITASGEASQGNYSVTFESADFTITKKSAKITVASSRKTYGETDPTFTGKVEGLVNDADLGTITYVRTGAAIDVNVGTYAGKLTAIFTANDNYDVTVVPADFTILPGTMTIAGVNYDGVYDGETHGEPAAASVIDGTSITYSLDGKTWSETVPTIVNAGLQNVSVKAENPNYKTATNTYTLNVTPREITLASADGDKFFDKTPLKVESAKLVEGEFVENEGFTYNFTGSQTAVGKSANKFTVSANENTLVDNYAITFVYGKLTVNPVVTFVMNGHGSEIADQNVLLGAKAVAPAKPSETGYMFEGWFTDRVFKNAYDFDSELNDNLTLYAKWSARMFEITFKNGTNTLSSKSMAYGTMPKYNGTAPTKPDTKDSTYEFIGWTPAIAPVTANAVYQAEYKSHVRVETIVVVYGSSKRDTLHVDILATDTEKQVNKKINAAMASHNPVINTPTKAMSSCYTYEFVKFVRNSTSGYYEPEFKNIPRHFTVSFNLPEKAKLSKSFEGYTYGNNVKLPDAYVDGDDSWEFKGWYTKPDGFGTKVKYISENDFGDKNVYPLLQKEVAYEVNGVKREVIVVYSETAEKSIRRALDGVMPADYVVGEVTYTFAYWTLGKDGVYTAHFTELTALRGTRVPHFNVAVNGRSLEITGAKKGSELFVYNMRGEVVAQGLIENATQHVNLVNPGSYIVRVNNQTIRVNAQ